MGEYSNESSLLENQELVENKDVLELVEWGISSAAVAAGGGDGGGYCCGCCSGFSFTFTFDSLVSKGSR